MMNIDLIKQLTWQDHFGLMLLYFLGLLLILMLLVLLFSLFRYIAISITKISEYDYLNRKIERLEKENELLRTENELRKNPKQS